MTTLEHFAPNLAGPATQELPLRRETEEGEEDHAEPGETEIREEEDGAEAAGAAPDGLIAEENANAEFLIGLDGSPNDDAVGRLASFQAKVALAEEAAKRLSTAAKNLQRAQGEAMAGDQPADSAMDLVADLHASEAEHQQVCVDLRSLARNMGENFQLEVEQHITASQRKSSPANLRIHTGAPLSLYDPTSWVACCVEFFYGDCVPNLDRPADISWRRLFDHLMNREELEYHLASDEPRYQANPDSRWNTPTFAALFADSVRRLAVLQSTKGFFEKHSSNFAKDLSTIAKATQKDFEAFQANLKQAALQNTSITGLISAARQQGAVAVQKTLHHMLMHTASAPLTEGNKQAIRHMGQALNTRFGPFNTFFTTNFPDTYHVITRVLAQGPGEPLGPRPLNLFQDSPPMPTSQEMHRIVAARPMIQANLFLLLDALTHNHLLGARRVFLGKRKYDSNYRWAKEPYVEDDFSSSGDVGVAGFVRALIKALEAQGRGFAHGHEKAHSEPITKATGLALTNIYPLSLYISLYRYIENIEINR